MHDYFKTLLVILLAAVMIFSFTACDEETSDAEIPTYIVVTEPTYPPFDTIDENGNIIGFDMDLLNSIAHYEGFKVEYKSMEFDSLIPALVSKEADIIAAGMNSSDPDRQEKVDFTETYYKSGLVLVVRSNETVIDGIDKLNQNTRVGSQTETTGAKECKELTDNDTIKDPVITDQFTTLIEQLQNGDIDAIIIDEEVAESYVRTSGDGIKIVGEPLNSETYGFAVQKGNTELQEKINEGLRKCINNGIYDELIAKWMN